MSLDDSRPNRRTGLAAASAALLFAIVCAFLVHRFAPYPSADSALASEDAFAEGLEEREFVPPMMGPGRWTSPGASFEFENLPQGPFTVEVRVRNHQDTVRVILERRSVGLIPPGQRGGDYKASLAGSDDDVQVDLVVKPFLARGGRRLGTFLDRVTLVHERTMMPRLELVAVFIVPALLVVPAARIAGASLSAVFALSCTVSLTQLCLLLPSGVVRSDYAYTLAALLAVGVGLLGIVSRRRPWLFAALLAAFLVQGAVALHPLVIGFDAAFHAHNLAEVLAGGYFLESETQHEPPFRFPYGVSFYVPLVPLVRAGVEPVQAVRVGASVAGVLAAAVAFWLVSRIDPRPWVAFLAVALLQFLPWSFDVYSNGNYSNVFAQAGIVTFIAWWALDKPLGWFAGTAAFVLGALGHLSGFFFLVALSLTLLVGRRRELKKERAGLIAIGLGMAGAVLYYSHFTSLVLEQLPRLLQGGRGGTGAQSLFESLLAQLGGVVSGWGVPAAILAWIGRPRAGAPMARELGAVWLAGALLAVAAVTTPVEVRYLYSLTFPLSIAAAAGVARLLQGGVSARIAAALLVVAQIALGGRNIALALLHDWRA
jgi:hypothetical protein